MNSTGHADATLEANISRRKKRYLRTIGGLLLAMYLPPVFAILIAIRWKTVSAWLRYGGVVLSLLIPPAILWSELVAKGAAHEHLSKGAPMWVCWLTYSFFSVSYMTHRGIRPSPLVKVGAAFIAFTLLLGTVMALLVYLRR